jgi:hypothetical protein
VGGELASTWAAAVLAIGVEDLAHQARDQATLSATM